MGRQVHFYMTEADEDAFLRFVRTTGDVHLYRYCSSSESPLELSSFELSSFAELATPNRLKFRPTGYLWNADVSPPPTMAPVPAQNRNCLDAMQSELVEFSPSVALDLEIADGRVYVDPARLIDDRVAMKGKEFLDWHAVLAGWIRRKYSYDRALRTYVSPAARALANQGWRLR